jgi:uroporphyrinogen decarboxylase
MKPNIQPRPNFQKFLDTLLLRKAWKRPPLFDFGVGENHAASFLGCYPLTGADWAEVYRLAGYDYVPLSICPPHPELDEKQQKEKSTGAVSYGSANVVIPSLEHFRSHRWTWQSVAEGDFSLLKANFTRLQEAAASLKPGMKIIIHAADIFTDAWMMLGFENFCVFSIEQPEFVLAVMDSIGAAQLRALQGGIDLVGDSVGAILFSDDIAYSEGLMLQPKFFIDHLFPYIHQIARMGQKIDAPLIYHSDGRLYKVFDALHEAGVRGIQPLEPKSMDPLEIKRRWPGKFCLIGNIDLDLMARGSADEVEAYVRDKIDRLNVDGGYIVGVSNTVPDYVKTENYIRMIETVYSYPDEQKAD